MRGLDRTVRESKSGCFAHAMAPAPSSSSSTPAGIRGLKGLRDKMNATSAGGLTGAGVVDERTYLCGNPFCRPAALAHLTQHTVQMQLSQSPPRSITAKR